MTPYCAEVVSGTPQSPVLLVIYSAANLTTGHFPSADDVELIDPRKQGIPTQTCLRAWGKWPDSWKLGRNPAEIE